MYKHYLTAALERLFLGIKNLGFWDEDSGKISEKLLHDENWNWNFQKTQNKRYGVFCLACLLLAKEYNNLDLNRFDDKIKVFGYNIYNKLSEYSKTDLTYGALLSVILANRLGYIEINEKKIENLLIDILEYAIQSFDNHNSLILIPASFFLTVHKSQRIKDGVEQLVSKYLKCVNKDNLFATGDLRFNYHQRTMYALWGLIHAAQHFYAGIIYDQIKKTLNYIWESRRQENIDNAFIWHPKIYSVKNRFKHVSLPILNFKSSKYLYECHQTFFANTINFFNRQFGEDFFVDERNKAISWIFGNNRMNLDLVKITNLDVPVRIMTLDKKLLVSGENFKGSYEIGSYILALSSFTNK